MKAILAVLFSIVLIAGCSSSSTPSDNNADLAKSVKIEAQKGLDRNAPGVYVLSVICAHKTGNEYNCLIKATDHQYDQTYAIVMDSSGNWVAE